MLERLGYSIILPASVVNEFRLDQLVQIRLSPRLIHSMSVVYPKERTHSRLINSFLRFAKQHLGANPLAPIECERTQT